MTRFFSENCSGDLIELSAEDAAHAHVIRLKKGERIVVCDSRGTDCLCEIEEISKNRVLAAVIERNPNKAEPAIPIVLFQSLLKADKMELVIQKAVELGVTEIVPIVTEHAISRETGGNKQKRWALISESAAKQSGRGIIPVVHPVITNSGWLNLYPDYLKIMFYEKATEPIGDLLKKGISGVSILIGPEGGFSVAETEKFREKGFVTASLGPRILRAETAAIAGLSIVTYLQNGVD